MSTIMDLLQSQLDDNALGALSKQLGSDETKTQGALSAALPLMLGALSRNASSGGGAQALHGAVARDHDGSILNDVAGFLNRGDTSDGQRILGHLFGTKQQRVENGLSKTTGMDTAQVTKLLAMAAPLLLGALGKTQRKTGMDANALAGMLGGEREAIEKKAPVEMGVLGNLLDADGDGDVDMSDLAQKGMGLLGGFLKR